MNKRRMDGLKKGRMQGGKEGKNGKRGPDERMDGWVDGWMNRQTS